VSTDNNSVFLFIRPVFFLRKTGFFVCKLCPIKKERNMFRKVLRIVLILTVVLALNGLSVAHAGIHAGNLVEIETPANLNGVTDSSRTLTVNLKYSNFSDVGVLIDGISIPLDARLIVREVGQTTTANLIEMKMSTVNFGFNGGVVQPHSSMVFATATIPAYKLPSNKSYEVTGIVVQYSGTIPSTILLAARPTTVITLR
jgi:hypothetical protein